MNIIVHPPENGNCSAVEDNDEDNPVIYNLPRALLVVPAEANAKEMCVQEATHSRSKHAKKTMKWDDPIPDGHEDFKILRDIPAGFDNCQDSC